MNSIYQKNWAAFWLYGITAVSLFVVIVTLFRPELNGDTRILQLLRSFIATRENNFGAWWSGVLLLIAAIHAFDGYALLRQTQPRAASGWVLIAIILLILSADEIGSIHERADRILPLGTSLSRAPFAIVLLAMLVYALNCLWSTKQQRTKVWPIVLAFLLFGSVAFQEYLEHRIDWTQEMDRYRAVIEEGTELLGMIILVKVSMTNTRGIFGQQGAGAFPTFQSICLLRLPMLAIGAVSTPILAYLTANLPDQQRGHPADWLAAMFFFFAALAASRRFFTHGENIGWLGWGLTALCCFGSAASVAIHPARVVELPLIDANTRMLVLFIMSLLICANWILSPAYKKRTYMLAAIVVTMLALFSLTQMSFLVVYGVTAYLGLLIYYVNSTQNCQLESRSAQ